MTGRSHGVDPGHDLLGQLFPQYSGRSSGPAIYHGSQHMRLTDEDARARLAAGDHGILCTVHADRGVDAVPAVYAIDDDYVGVPIDTVKPKSSLRLQRERNLEADPRATLLVERWNRDDWTQLWWVRAELRWQGDADDERTDALATRLTERFAQYHDRPFHRLLVLRVVGVSGWAA